MQMTLMQCPPRLMGEKLRKCHVFLSGINDSKTARMSKSQMKKMFITFFDIKGNVHFEFIYRHAEEMTQGTYGMHTKFW
jgi:hypothetical protein